MGVLGVYRETSGVPGSFKRYEDCFKDDLVVSGGFQIIKA